MKTAAVAIVLSALSTPLAAQWLSHLTPGIPRNADGKPNLTGLLLMLNVDLTYRQIFTDSLQTNPNPSWMGYSVGRWEGDTLVVESNGFNDTTLGKSPCSTNIRNHIR